MPKTSKEHLFHLWLQTDCFMLGPAVCSETVFLMPCGYLGHSISNVSPHPPLIFDINTAFSSSRLALTDCFLLFKQFSVGTKMWLCIKLQTVDRHMLDSTKNPPISPFCCDLWFWSLTKQIAQLYDGCKRQFEQLPTRHCSLFYCVPPVCSGLSWTWDTGNEKVAEKNKLI